MKYLSDKNKVVLGLSSKWFKIHVLNLKLAELYLLWKFTEKPIFIAQLKQKILMDKINFKINVRLWVCEIQFFLFENCGIAKKIAELCDKEITLKKIIDDKKLVNFEKNPPFSMFTHIFRHYLD